MNIQDSPNQIYARTVFDYDGNPLPEKYQLLPDHLFAVAELARQFGKKIGVADWCYLAGLWHDIGKYHPAFQEMLLEAASGATKKRVDHSSAGAIHAQKIIGGALKKHRSGRLLGYVMNLLTATIAGHHAGLADGQAELDFRLKKKLNLYNEVRSQNPWEKILYPVDRIPSLPRRLIGAQDGERRLRTEFFVRMIFSVLVDADRLDAERAGGAALPEHLQESRQRKVYSTLSEIRKAVDDYIENKVRNLNPQTMTDVEKRLFDYRQVILRACREAAEWSPGVFALDVATGGGKTLSSLSFALRHAEKYGKDRIIVVIPYTSIIEQTAAIYREALGNLSGNLIEHHSAVSENFETREESDFSDPEAENRRLSTENWDAPLIVTTAVQFFESLYSWTPSRCRKLHNICNSVVVIDEAQTFPPQLLNPTVWAINELVEAYKVSVVLSTATQPALEKPFPEVRNLKSIVPRELKPPPLRVRVDLFQKENATWSDLAEEISRHKQVLCIIHKRSDARNLAIELDRKLGDESAIHLSANMCPVHRSERIEEIRKRLIHGDACRVVSTQLVEAGVDLDFPVVYRSLAGVDSLIQAAGRANREGRLGEEGGLLCVYKAPTEPPPGLLRLASEAAKTLWRSSTLDGRPFKVFSPETGREFFRKYFDKIDDMDGGITPRRREFKFREVAARYQFIQDSGCLIVVPYNDKVKKTIMLIRRFGISRQNLRRLQRYTVNVFPRAMQMLQYAGAVECLIPGDEESENGIYVLASNLMDIYDQRFGIDLSKIGCPEADSLII